VRLSLGQSAFVDLAARLVPHSRLLRSSTPRANVRHCRPSHLRAMIRVSRKT
jgi:hypothetical protein